MRVPIKKWACTFATTALLTACSPDELSTNSVVDHASDPEIIVKLQEIVTLRQREFETEQVLKELGKGSMDGAAELALANAQIALARERGQGDVVATELRKLVKTYQATLDRATALAEENRQTKSALSQLRVALLEAEVRLRRELIDQKSTE